ncbi:hypothetical protein LCM00_13585 [Bacillus infantis]|uniref:hypothetical protein n=1 Tax=Bacillus infantis TaxID=324767 RepID=UPI001CD3956B|nr:hypothetical protein [Bacillus infantis]MCA1040540.1 hypothetical protein [Bacillus infantis]
MEKKKLLLELIAEKMTEFTKMYPVLSVKTFNMNSVKKTYVRKKSFEYACCEALNN